ncbi:MAG TPA: nucleoside deaminase [Candidatus Acidoferrales bacterium]|nr:nucleoside deaminase [Candidatus Acidoferrales bacterium]
MRRAIALAIENVRSGSGGPFAALVVKDDKVLAEGTNRVTALNDPTAHAEILAIREACRKIGHFELKGCGIYASCEPCPMCLGAIYWARPAKIYFGGAAADAARIGFDDSLIYMEMRAPFSKRRIPMIQHLREEALEAFRAWQNERDKIRY